MMSSRKLSIIIVSYNTCELLDQCLESLSRFSPGAEVIVVDNGSRDESVAMVRSKHPDVLIEDTGKNLGFAGANNLGIQRSSGDYVLLLNSDTVLEDDSLSRCVAWMDANPELGAISPSLIGMDDQPQQCFYRFPSLADRLREAFAGRSSAGESDVAQVGWIAGTALMIRRTALEQIGGGLDAKYWMYWEDADTSAQLIEKGWQVAEYKDAVVRHYGGASGGGPDASRRGDLYAWYAWGEHRWFTKHRPIWESMSLWALDFLDLFRRTGRGLLRPGRRSELSHARVLAHVLWWRLIGFQPPVPGGK